MLEALLVSTAVVAVGELGDKTQLLSLVLAARFQKPWPIVAGILVATLANHALAGLAGNWVRSVVPEDVLRWLLALSFFAVAAWALKPDKLDDDDAPPASRWGVFAATTVAFFIAEIGDKTQIATVMLAARFESLPAVVAGHDARHADRERAHGVPGQRRLREDPVPPRAHRRRRAVRGARRLGAAGAARRRMTPVPPV